MTDLKKYAQVKVTPSDITILTVTNPLSVVPKYVHITCAHDSAPYASNGYLKELWATPKQGGSLGTNGSNGVNTYRLFTPVSQIPTSIEKFYLSSDTISFYKANGSISGRWHTDTEYTVHIYA